MAAVASQRPFRKRRAGAAFAAPLTDIARNGRKTPVSARTGRSPRASFVPWLTQIRAKRYGFAGWIRSRLATAAPGSTGCKRS
jgi:hypothetical protein